MKLPSFFSVIDYAAETFKRFPLAILFAFMGSAYCISWARLPYNASDSYFYSNIVRSCYLGMLLSISVTIFSEKMRWSSKLKTIARLAAIALVAAYYFSLPQQFLTISLTRFILFTLVLHLIISFMPFINNGGINGFWNYNKTIFLRILTAALYTIVLYLGLILAIAATDKLFNANFDNKIYLDLWIILTGIFNTWFFLAGFPSNFESLEKIKDYPKGLKIFTQYVLLPLVTVYLGILYAYMFKIIVSGQWPVGWVSYLVIGFSIAGILSLLLIYPVRNDENNKWILIFSRFFYFALFPLVVLLFFAVKRRISDYGITEQRYFLFVLALWLLFIAIYFLVSKTKNIKLIPISLCLLALISSFGPWGAFKVSLASQKHRLIELLQKNSMLSQGKIVTVKSQIPFKDHKQISSIINYLVEVHGYKTLQPFFVQNLDSALKKEKNDNYSYSKVNKIHSMMNLSYIPDYQMNEDLSDNKYINFYTENSNQFINIGGYDNVITDFNLYENNNGSACNQYLLGENKISVCFDSKKQQLKVFDESEKDSALVFDINAFISNLQKSYVSEYYSIPSEKMTLISGNSKLKAKIVLKNMHFYKQESNISQFGMEGILFVSDNKF
ncbi:MAG: DUF4153 domain-containing protein [Bacteroidota bacterium]|nr:DUF4153 domain-containing protein [Bacteroidota bacterium]